MYFSTPPLLLTWIEVTDEESMGDRVGKGESEKI